jgi:predicted DNA-binding transcriptional regulator AlpA
MTELINTEEAARRLQISPGTLTVWRSTRRYPLKFCKIGRKVRYRATDIEEFIDNRTMSGVAESRASSRKA